jgi:hypothetical protein
MLSGLEFARQSLDLHLFFARIMKEHSFFLQIGFTQRDVGFIGRADEFRKEFDRLLTEAVSLANGVASPVVLRSGEVVTRYTQEAESASSFFTGIQIPAGITQSEAGLAGGDGAEATPALERRVYALNQRAIDLTTGLIRFKENILSNVLSCRMFTVNYPLLITHIIREARLYLQMLQRLQNREQPGEDREALNLEFFWNRQMAEHAKFIRGLLDPTENDLFDLADNFGDVFDRLTAEAKAAIDMTAPRERVTEESLRATQELRDFKEQGTQGILACQIKSIIIPLLGDHVLREANHYLRLLRMFER